jgi:hypothetical protein
MWQFHWYALNCVNFCAKFGAGYSLSLYFLRCGWDACMCSVCFMYYRPVRFADITRVLSSYLRIVCIFHLIKQLKKCSYNYIMDEIALSCSPFL